MIKRAEASCVGGLRALQREAVPMLLETFDAKGPASIYASNRLQWHVRQAQMQDVAINCDALLMRVFTHENGEVRAQGALGVGLGVLRDSADACDVAGEHLLSAQLMFASCAMRGSASGTEAKRAWASLRELNDAGHDSSTSRALESNVLNALVFATEGGYAFGSTEHDEAMQRMRVLGRRQSLGAADTNGGAAVVEAEYGLAMAAIMSAASIEGVASYPGPMTSTMVVQSDAFMRQAVHHVANAATALAGAASVASMWSVHHYCALAACPRRHTLPDFSFEAECGQDGARLRENIER